MFAMVVTVIKLSLASIIIGLIFIIGMSISLVSINGSPPNNVKIVQAVFGVTAFMMFVLGFSGFQSNAVQFGLDQLLDACSEELSLFLHWFVWTEYVGVFLAHLHTVLVKRSIITQV